MQIPEITKTKFTPKRNNEQCPNVNYKTTNNAIVNNTTKGTLLTTEAADKIADYLVTKFSSPDSRKFYCLVAYKLPTSRISFLVDYCYKEARHPARLFNYLARQEMK